MITVQKKKVSMYIETNSEGTNIVFTELKNDRALHRIPVADSETAIFLMKKHKVDPLKPYKCKDAIFRWLKAEYEDFRVEQAYLKSERAGMKVA